MPYILGWREYLGIHGLDDDCFCAIILFGVPSAFMGTSCWCGVSLGRRGACLRFFGVVTCLVRWEL
jgi:hypothetical protein